MVDRYLLRYFLAVIDRGSFSKAAAHCHVSQPTLSIGVAKLERELGRTLFNRTNRRVALTEAGAALAVRARRIEADFAAMETPIKDGATKAVVRLGVLPTIPVGLVERLSAAVRHHGAGRSLELIEARAGDLNDRLGRHRLDAALTLLHPDRERHAAEPLFTEGYRLALSTDHPLAGRSRVFAEELAGEPMIVHRHCELMAETSRHFVSRGVRPVFAAKTTNDDRALAYVRAGLGCTVMPDGYRAPGVARVDLADFTYTRGIGLVAAPHAVDDAAIGPWFRDSVRLAVAEYLSDA